MLKSLKLLFVIQIAAMSGMVCFPKCGYAETYYVDQKNPEASDNNPGAETKPWKTISKAASTLVAGHTVYVKGGTYRETIRPFNSGTENAPITYQAYADEEVVVKGSILVKDWEPDTMKGVWKKAKWYNPDPKDIFLTDRVQEIFQKDASLDGAIKLIPVAKYSDIEEGKFFVDREKNILYIYPYNGQDANKTDIEVSVRTLLLCVQGQNYLRFKGFCFRHSATRPIYDLAPWYSDSALLFWGNSNVLENCLVSWMDFCGIRVRGKDSVVRNSTFSHNGLCGLGVHSGEKILIENVKCVYNNLARYFYGWHSGGAKLVPYFNNSIIRNSEFAYNVGPGLWLDIGCNNNIIENNVCHDNEGPGIMIEISSENILKNNICYNNKNYDSGYFLNLNQAVTPAMKEWPDFETFYAESQPWGGDGIYVSCSPNTKVFNNLCYYNESNGIRAEGGTRPDMKTASTRNTRIINNILVDNNGVQLIIRKNGVAEDSFGNESDYNLFFSSMGRPLVKWGDAGSLYNRLNNWQTESNQDRHSIEGSPEFISGGTRTNFHVFLTSPAIDKGILLEEVPTDFDGIKRPQGVNADIGPYETKAKERKAAVNKPKPPKELKYFTVDLSPYVNRGLIDEVENDGLGGWTDQGPSCDLRTFPTQEQVFNGVPFKILEPKSCIVLKSGQRKTGNLPEAVKGIKVNHPVNVLYFLHSGAWISDGAYYGKYVIHLADGNNAEIPLVGGATIKDWALISPDSPFKDDNLSTTGSVAWTGSNPTFQKVSVYVLEWVNTNPWLDIVSIDFIGTGSGIPILLAITGGTAIQDKEAR